MEHVGRDQAFARVLKELGKEYEGIKMPYLKEAVHNAHNGWRSTAWNNALMAGIPVERLKAVYALIYE